MHLLNGFFNLVGAPLLVILFYWFRFQTLKGTRSFTTRGLFYVGIAVFVAPFLLIYFLLPKGLSPLAAIWIVIFVWLVPRFPVWWREVCHDLARIPSCAHQFRDLLARSFFELRAEDTAAIRRKLARVGYQVDDFRAVQSTAIQSRFLKITAIMYRLEEWNLKGEAFIRRNSEQYFELLRVYDLLSFKAIRALKNTTAVYGAIMEDSKVQPDDWHALDSLAARNTSSTRLQTVAQTAAGGTLEDLRKDMDFLLDALLLFVARYALASEWNFFGRKRRLEAIGFKISAPAPAIMKNVIAAAVITIGWSVGWLVVWGSGAIAGNLFFGALRTLLVSPLMLIGAFWLVHHLKSNYAFANQSMFGGPPIGFVFVAGTLSALLALPLQSLFDYYQFVADDLKPGVTLIEALMKYLSVWAPNLLILLFPWAVGAVTAALVQEPVWNNVESRRMKRVLDGVVFGVVLAVSVIIIIAIDRMLFHIPVMEGLRQWSILQITGMLMQTVAFGFVMGYLVIAPIRQGSPLQVAYTEFMVSGGAKLRTGWRLIAAKADALLAGRAAAFTRSDAPR